MKTKTSEKVFYKAALAPGGVQDWPMLHPIVSGSVRRNQTIRQRVHVIWRVKVANTKTRGIKQWCIRTTKNNSIAVVGERGLHIAMEIQLAEKKGSRLEFLDRPKWIGHPAAMIPMSTEEILFGGHRLNAQYALNAIKNGLN